MRRPERAVILTADDFGADVGVNEAVEQAYRQGVLTCASLMVAEPGTADAVARAKRLPGLRVGLHLALADGQALSAASQIPDLVNRSGRFRGTMVGAGVRFYFSRRVRAQLKHEIRAQFAAFHATGLALDHVNAHKHFHLHPTVLELLLTVGRDYGLRAVRLPYEPALAYQGAGAAARAMGVFLAGVVRHVRHRLVREGVRSNDYLFGIAHTGGMNEDALLRLIPRLPAGVSELYFHPTIRAGGADELTGLLSPRVRAALRDVRRTSFSELV